MLNVLVLVLLAVVAVGGFAAVCWWMLTRVPASILPVPLEQWLDSPEWLDSLQSQPPPTGDG